MTTAHEIGKAIFPLGARGQIEGGTAQGLGYALTEEVVMRDGAMANAQLTNYIVPTTLDTPPMDVVLVEKPYAHGPYGAKGVGEMPFDGVAPAVVNAIRSLGLDIREVPATPERVMAAPRFGTPPSPGDSAAGFGEAGGIRDSGFATTLRRQPRTSRAQATDGTAMTARPSPHRVHAEREAGRRCACTR